jgi:integrase
MLKFRVPSGRQRWQALGRVGRLAPDEARAKARAILVAVDKGNDPGARRTTVRDLRVSFVANVAAKKKRSTAANYDAVLAKHVLPGLGDCQAELVTSADIADLHRKIGKKYPAQANAMLRIVSSMYTHGARQHLVPAGFNPANGIERFREQPRKRRLSSEELARLGAALREAETIGLPYAIDETKPAAKHAASIEKRRVIIGPHVTAALRLYMFTGARKREILDRRWPDVDYEHGVLNLADSKTGPKQILLNPAALQILAGLPRISDYVIAGADPNKPRADLKKPWAAICKAARLKDLHIHDLRHLHGSMAGNARFTTLMIAKLLGHAQAKTAERYIHLADDPLRQASQRVAGDIAAALGEAPAVSAKVTSIRGDGS